MPSPSPIPTPEPHLSVHLSQNYGEPLQCDVKIDGRKVFSGVTWEALTPAVKVPRVSSDRAGDIMREFFSTHPSVTNRGSTPADDLPGDRRVNVTITDVYAVPDEHGFLRINVGPETAVIDPKASNVTVTDVSDAPTDDLPGEPVEPCGRDVGDATYCPCLLPRSHDGLHSCKHTEPAPADDLPGEPVEPGDLRAGDRVAFKWDGGRHTCTLVSVHDGIVLRSDIPDSDGFATNVVWGRKWASGISDVRLIERAPREDDDRDEALAMDLYHASLKIPPVSEIGPTAWDDATRQKWLDVARMAREHIEAEREGRERTVVDEWDDMLARAENAEKALDNATQRVLDLTAERDALRERLDALRADVERGAVQGPPGAGEARLRCRRILARADERAAKGEQR